MACMELSNTSAVVQECQRYFDSVAFGYLGTVASSCAPVDDDCLEDGKVGYYSCSNQLPNAVVACPGGISAATFCSADGDDDTTCAYESMLTTSEYTPTEAAFLMCETLAPTSSAFVSVDGASDDFCYNYGWCVGAMRCLFPQLLAEGAPVWPSSTTGGIFSPKPSFHGTRRSHASFLRSPMCRIGITRGWTRANSRGWRTGPTFV